MKYSLVTALVLMVMFSVAFAEDLHPKVSVGVKVVALADAKAVIKTDHIDMALPPNLKIGLVVLTVTDNGSFAQAGIQKGDIITRIGAMALKDNDALRQWVGSAEIDKNYDITFMRMNAKGGWTWHTLSFKTKLAVQAQDVTAPVVKQTNAEPKAPIASPIPVVAPKLTPSGQSPQSNGKPKFDIKGQRIGDIINKEWAYSHCPGNQLEEHLGYAISKDFTTLSETGKPADGNITGSEVINVDGSGSDDPKKGVFVIYTFEARKLIGVDLVFDTSFFDLLKTTYIDKFALAPTITYQKVTTHMGVEYTNEIDTWQTDSGPFILRRYGSDIEKGAGVLWTPEMAKFSAEKESQKQKDLKSKL